MNTIEENNAIINAKAELHHSEGLSNNKLRAIVESSECDAEEKAAANLLLHWRKVGAV